MDRPVYRSLKKTVLSEIGVQQHLQFAKQFVIAAAGLLQEGRPVSGSKLGGLME
jgi:hypothetical protein